MTQHEKMQNKGLSLAGQPDQSTDPSVFLVPFGLVLGTPFSLKAATTHRSCCKRVTEFSS